MGYMTLADFRTEVQSALGDRGLDNARLDRWVNFAYLDLVGSIQFPDLTEEDTSQSTTGAVNFINVPTGAMVVLLVRNTADDNKLGWIPLDEYWRLSQGTTSAPTKWSRQKAKVMLHPVPNAVKTMRIVYIKTPARLSAVGDTTGLPDTWDAAVFLFAVHHGLLALGEEARAAAWFQRAAAYTQTRITESNLVALTPGLGLTLPMVNGQPVQSGAQ